MFRSGRSQITNQPNEAAEHDREVGRRIGFATETILTVPLRYQAGRPVGVLQILNKQSGAFEHDDLEVLEIVASVAAAAIETAQLARDAQTAAIVHAVGDLSHDIKNKVSPIVIGIQALRSDLDEMFAAETPLPPSADAVREGYGYTFDIVMDQVEAIQEYAKLLADALKGVMTEPELEPNDPALVVEGQLLSLDPVARHRGVALHRRFAAVPTFRFDRFQVERAAYNLVSNAIAATPRGGYVTVAITVRPEERFAGGRALEIVVSDTGSGMPPDILAPRPPRRAPQHQAGRHRARDAHRLQRGRRPPRHLRGREHPRGRHDVPPPAAVGGPGVLTLSARRPGAPGRRSGARRHAAYPRGSADGRSATTPPRTAPNDPRACDPRLAIRRASVSPTATVPLASTMKGFQARYEDRSTSTCHTRAGGAWIPRSEHDRHRRDPDDEVRRAPRERRRARELHPG